MKEIQLVPIKHGLVALVDDEDYARVAGFKWRRAHSRRDANTWYAVRAEWSKEKGRNVFFLLHREVLGIADPAVKVDHENRNGLDCRRSNLRIATNAQNLANRGVQANNTSGYKGVSYDKSRNKWRASVGTSQIGRFSTAEEAARAYDRAAIQVYGKFAQTNQPTNLTASIN